MMQEGFTTKTRRHEEEFLARSAEKETFFVPFVFSWFKRFFSCELA